MPTIITHTVLAGAAVKTFSRTPLPLRFWIIAIFCSVIPDADVIGFSYGISYGDFLGHRGFFHSIFFAFLLAIFCASVFFQGYKLFSKRWLKYVLFFFVIGASHGILDAFTNGGLGIALLSPFDNTRYFAPWTPIKVSPIGIRGFISYWGLQVMISEIIYIWLPLFIIYSGSRIVRNIFNRSLNIKM